MEEAGREQLAKFEKAFRKLEKRLSKVLELDEKTVEKEWSPLQKAELNVVVAKSINVLYLMHLKTQGIDVKEHPIEKELERIRKFEEKISKAKKASESAPGKLPKDFKKKLREGGKRKRKEEENN